MENNLTYSPPTIIVDVDGTVADCSHRLRFVQSTPKNWPAFNRRMNKDTPHLDIIWMVKTFHAAGSIILIASGRGSEDREVTIDWLDNVAGLKGIYSKLYMRPRKDNRADNIIKKELLDQMRADGYNPTIAIDDRPSVLRMWRDNGIRTLAVGPQEEF